MLRLFLLTMLLSYAGSGLAQGNFPFPEPGAEWHVTQVLPILGPNDGYARWMYRATGDSVSVNDTVYHTVTARGTCFSDLTTGYQYAPYTPAQYAVIGGLRHAGGRIRFRRFSTPPFTGRPPTLSAYPVDQEVLLCDFTLVTGDTFTTFNGVKYKVDKTETTPQGRKRVHLAFQDCGFPGTVIWEEGRGPTRGLLETLSLCFFSGSCYRSDVAPYAAEVCSLPCTPGDGVLVATQETDADIDIAVWPNPAQDHILIRLPDGLNWQIRLYDLAGRGLHSAEGLSDMARIDLGGVWPGTYLLEVRSASDRPVHRRLLVIN